MILQDDAKQYMMNWLREYINENCLVRINPAKEKLLPGRKKGDEYGSQYYMRRGLFNAKFLNYVGILFWDMFYEEYIKEPFQISGLETGATPIIIGLTMSARAFDLDVKSFSIRKERKTYGLLNRMEGIVDPDLPVLLVDDLCNSKESMWVAKKYCEEENIKIYKSAFVILNKIHRQEWNDTNPELHTKDKYLGRDIEIKNLFYADDFDASFKRYQINKYLQQKQVDI